jgi:hypothetical protein
MTASVTFDPHIPTSISWSVVEIKGQGESSESLPSENRDQVISSIGEEAINSNVEEHVIDGSEDIESKLALIEKNFIQARMKLSRINFSIITSTVFTSVLGFMWDDQKMILVSMLINCSLLGPILVDSAINHFQNRSNNSVIEIV